MTPAEYAARDVGLETWWKNRINLYPLAKTYQRETGHLPDGYEFTQRFGGAWNPATGGYMRPGGGEVGAERSIVTPVPVPGANVPEGQRGEEEAAPWTAYLRAVGETGLRENSPYEQWVQSQRDRILGQLSAQQMVGLYKEDATVPDTSAFVRGQVGGLTGLNLGRDVDVKSLLREMTTASQTGDQNKGEFKSYLADLAGGDTGALNKLQNMIMAGSKLAAPLRNQVYDRGAISNEYQKFRAFDPTGDFLGYLKARSWF